MRQVAPPFTADELSYNYFIQEYFISFIYCKLITWDKISIFFQSPFSYLLHKVECLLFGLFLFQISSLVFCLVALTISVGALVTRERCIILDIAKVSRIAIFSSKVKFCILHNLSSFSIFWACLIKFSPVSSFLLWEKCIRRILLFFG